MPKFIGSMKQLRYLDLSDSFQFAIVPHEWGNLTELEVLDLHGYYHPGAVDDFQWLSHLQALKYLDMSGIHVNKSGDFMQVISALPYLSHLSLSNCGLYNFHLSFDCLANSTALHLEYLDLSMNSLEGPIPSIPFQNMTSLQHLYLFSNSFNSLVPRWFNSLRSLVNLNLADNLLQSIEGGLFSFLREHTFLESLCLNVNELHEEIFSVEGSSSGLIGENFKQLRIGKNMLQGTLPDWLFHLKNLTVLDLSYNQLHGIIPSPYDWVCLRVLLLSVNQLTGNIPDAFGRLQVLSILDLSNNLLNGTIPQSLGQLQYLFSLDLSANSLRGTISKIHFSNLSKLQILDISNNHLAIEVDSDWIPPFNLQYMGMVSCKFGTEFPRWIRTQAGLTRISLSNASISGPIPKDIDLAMPHLTILNLNDNLLSGSIPTSICEMEQLYDLHLGRNELVGEIPTCWKESPKSLLDISSNKLSGVIPSSLGNLIRLTSLHLNNNKLQGGIPVTIKYCRNLRILDLGENKIASSVPHWIGPSFPLLQILRLRENMFNGSIPSQLCLLSALQILDMAVNNLTGTIPNCLGHMKGLKLNKSIDEGNSLASPDIPTTDWTQEHVEQVVKGVDLDYTTLDLKLMVNLDLSSNKLVGPILRELTLLSGLRGLNLSRNFLSGGIPTMIGDMRLLESLDLSNNHLSGTIPQSFSAFISLSKLDLSHNNFTGPIPKGNQIQTLDDPSIYADNPLLCGDPLQKKCPKAEAPRAPKEVANEEGKLEKVMFYIVIMLGFATGFWAVVGSLVYKKNWRQVYFNFVDRKVDMVYVIVAVKAAELRRRLRRV
ncbi:receptor-like protein EIX1 [Eucalyptus grandis]|uniref:receptor-like protein EIX1 n=1 Tax=Eucalyptus grandis TaxID=71139 RepID=UPI00192EBAA0|nr:receptor-like protein EIX1 [Eucalyptus grandis]